jgi:hypothetical protein
MVNCFSPASESLSFPVELHLNRHLSWFAPLKGWNMKKYLMIIAALSLAACAKKPESISASYISERNYLSYQCDELAQEDSRLAGAYAQAAQQQNNARTNDTVGVLLLGLPVSSMSGDNIAPEIARLKGEQDAVRRARSKRGC